MAQIESLLERTAAAKEDFAGLAKALCELSADEGRLVQLQSNLADNLRVLRETQQIEDALHGLTGAIHTSNAHRIEQFISRYRAGLVSINGPTYGAGPHMPFGGVKHSGNGFREPGTEALDVYCEWKTVVVNHDPTRV